MRRGLRSRAIDLGECISRTTAPVGLGERQTVDNLHTRVNRGRSRSAPRARRHLSAYLKENRAYRRARTRLPRGIVTRCRSSANVGGCLAKHEADHTPAGRTSCRQSKRLGMSGQDLDEDVTLSDYDPAWPRTASKLACRLAALLRELDAKVEYIGSTAVPGLEAKPVIDLLVGVPSRQRSTRHQSVCGDGWQDFGEAGVAGRRYLRLRQPEACNLHLVLADGVHWANNLALRDYLRSHPDEAYEYAAAKRNALKLGHTKSAAVAWRRLRRDSSGSPSPSDVRAGWGTTGRGRRRRSARRVRSTECGRPAGGTRTAPCAR